MTDSNKIHRSSLLLLVSVMILYRENKLVIEPGGLILLAKMETQCVYHSLLWSAAQFAKNKNV